MIYKKCKTPGYEKVILCDNFMGTKTELDKIAKELDTRKNDELDKKLLKCWLQGIVELIQSQDYVISNNQAKAIAEYLERFYADY